MDDYITFWLSKNIIELIGTGIILLVLIIVGLITHFVEVKRRKKLEKKLEEIRQKVQREAAIRYDEEELPQKLEEQINGN